MRHNIKVLSIDLGATSGRLVLFDIGEEKLIQNEIHRFQNNFQIVNGRYYWNIFSIFHEIEKGLKIVSQNKIHLDGIGVDSWGVDFGFVSKDGEILSMPRSYRDPFTRDISKLFFKNISKATVYQKTGIQTIDFNTLFQLYALKSSDSEIKKIASTMLFIPDLINYILTGKQVCEYTVASTSQMLDYLLRDFDSDLLAEVKMNRKQIPKIVSPGTLIGLLKEEYASFLGETPVFAVAAHDTASAIVAVPATDRYFAYLSSGTWSMMGIELDNPIVNKETEQHNFTNEGGIDGTYRFLKNITGMWILEQILKELKFQGKEYSYEDVICLASSNKDNVPVIDPDDSLFVSPESMKQAIKEYCRKTTQKYSETDADLFKMIFLSMVLKYRYVMEELKKVAPFEIRRLHVIGGGAKNNYLNQLIADSLQMPVYVGPIEATAIGNALMQAKALGIFSTKEQMREYLSRMVPQVCFEPQTKEDWNTLYLNFINIIHK